MWGTLQREAQWSALPEAGFTVLRDEAAMRNDAKLLLLASNALHKSTVRRARTPTPPPKALSPFFHFFLPHAHRLSGIFLLVSQRAGAEEVALRRPEARRQILAPASRVGGGPAGQAPAQQR